MFPQRGRDQNPTLGRLSLSSLYHNEVDPLLAQTPYGHVLQGAMDFRQPIMDAIQGVDDEKALVEMLGYYLESKMNKPVSGQNLPVLPRNSASVISPEQSRLHQLYQAL